MSEPLEDRLSPQRSTAGTGALAIRGASWTALAQMSRQGLQFIFGLALARLLSPEEFGIFAMALVVSGFAGVIGDVGLSAALVQAKGLTQVQRSTVFWLNFCIAILLGGTVAASGPLLADFYDEPKVVRITALLGCGVWIGVLGSVHRSLMVRDMRFRGIAVVDVGASVIGGVSGVALAAAGAGPMALAWQQVLTAVAATVGVAMVGGWRPTFRFSIGDCRSLISYGGNLAGFSALNFWSRNADNLLIGRFVGSVELGNYSRAYSLMLLPLNNVSRVLGNVMLSSLSRLQDSRERVRTAYLRAVQVIAVITFPIVAGSAVAAPDLIPAVLGDQWFDAILLYQILAVAGLSQSIGTTTGWLYQALGRTSLLLRWGLFSTGVTIVAFLIGVQWGAVGVATAYSIRTYLLAALNLTIAGGLIDARLSAVLRSVLRPLAGAAVVALSVWITMKLVKPLGAAPSVAAEVAAGAISYFLFGVVAGGEPFREAFRALGAIRQSTDQATDS